MTKVAAKKAEPKKLDTKKPTAKDQKSESKPKMVTDRLKKPIEESQSDHAKSDTEEASQHSKNKSLNNTQKSAKSDAKPKPKSAKDKNAKP